MLPLELARLGAVPVSLVAEVHEGAEELSRRELNLGQVRPLVTGLVRGRVDAVTEACSGDQTERPRLVGT